MANEKRVRDILQDLVNLWPSIDFVRYKPDMPYHPSIGEIINSARDFLAAESSKAKAGQTAPPKKLPSFPDWAKRHGLGREVPEGDGWSWEFEPREEARKAYDELVGEPTGQAQPDICPRCESHYRNFKTLHCIADTHKWHSEEGREWPRQEQEAPKEK
jgi:hypothetical protein